MKPEARRIGAMLENIKSRISVVTKTLPVLYRESDYKTGNELPVVDGTFVPFAPGTRWGGKADTHAWFFVELPQDEAFEGKNIEIMPFPPNGYGESMNAQYIAYVDGEMLCGLDMYHQSAPIVYRAGCKIFLYAYTGMCFDREMEFSCYAQQIDEDARSLYYDMAVPFDVLSYLDENSKDYADILTLLTGAVNLLDIHSPGGWRTSLTAAIGFMKEEFYKKYAKKQDMTTICIGHTHIDVAWLWSLDQTREKVQRTFSTILMLMRKYPDFIFMTSQAQLLEFFFEEAPKELQDELRMRVKEGRFEVEGGMWLEADCNLISGESMVRQLLFGKRYFKKEFDVDSHILWLPDVFGYSASMPQILQKSGVDRFVTSKISWNDTNQMPHDTFMWQGIDGTEIFTHFLTAQDKVRGGHPSNFTTYVGIPEPRQIMGTWDRYQDKHLNNEIINTFGYGDGGGGPTAEHIEKIRRMEAGIPGCANTKIDRAESFLERLYEKASKNDKLAKWNGDLYLEFHRGTYTSIAKNKRNNRKAEFLMMNTEWLSSFASILCGEEYDESLIDECWKTILLNQFHDIIPGSSIKQVYEDSDKEYEALFAKAGGLFDRLKTEIAKQISKAGTVVFNPNAFPAGGIVEADGQLLHVEDIPAKGYRVVETSDSFQKPSLTDYCLENEYLKVTFSKSYEIEKIYDKKAGREVLKNGGVGNRLIAFDDSCVYEFDAWELKDFHTEKSWVIDDVSAVERIDNGLQAGFTITRKFLESTITQTVLLSANSGVLSFDNDVDWQNHHLILKAEFPVDINANKAVYDIQFGNIERSTHRNTSWDAAKFEVCGHKFADLSQGDYGVALMNDCKYGYAIHDSVMRLTLLKSATDPNPDADIGRHVFKYALYPHQNAFAASDTLRQAYLFNNPLFAASSSGGGSLAGKGCTVCCDAENVICETVKKAGNGYLIRAYEGLNKRATAKMGFGFPIKKAFLCDLMENELEELTVCENSLTVPFKPFEIISIKVVV